VIQVEHFYYKYPDAPIYALEDINLEVNEGEFVGIIGPNGAGKTTLCNALNGLIPRSIGGKTQGKVVVAGMNTLEHSVAELALQAGLVFSDPESQLSQLTVSEEIAFGPANLGIPKDEVFRRVEEMAALVGLEGKLNRLPISLSGGEMQRVAIASVLAMHPRVIVLDEPTANLDPIGAKEVFSVVKNLKEKTKMSVVMAEHQVEHLATYADRIVVMNGGKIILDGETKSVLKETTTLEEISIKPPQVTEMAQLFFNQCGISLGMPLTVEEAYEQIVKKLK